MDVLRKEKLYTVNDIYALPDGERAELIDGQIYYMAAPNRIHQRLLGNISYQIMDYIRNQNGDCEIYMAPFAVFLNNDNINYVEPDISVICDSSKLDDLGCHGAPDWVIEIVSPSSCSMDYFKKLFKYRTAGVKEYWIVDPKKELVMIYHLEKEIVEQYSFEEAIPVGIYEGFSIKVQ